jgi:hypothetical protein
MTIQRSKLRSTASKAFPAPSSSHPGCCDDAVHGSQLATPHRLPGCAWSPAYTDACSRTCRSGGYSRGSYLPVDRALRSAPGADVQARRRRECRRRLSWPLEAGFALPAFLSLSAGAQRPRHTHRGMLSEADGSQAPPASPVRQNDPVCSPSLTRAEKATAVQNGFYVRGPAGVPGQDPAEVAGSAGDGAAADLAARDPMRGSGHREAAGTLNYSSDLVKPGPSR